MEYYRTDELYHHGIKGQRWGVRRYQNPDGTLTNAGKRRVKAFREMADIAEGNANRLTKETERLKEDNKGLHERYDGKDGWRIFAEDAYGTTNPKDFNLSEKEFKDWMSSELKTNLDYSDSTDRITISKYEQAAKKWMDFSKDSRMVSTGGISVDKITNKDIRTIKAFVASQKYLNSSLSDLVDLTSAF